MPEAQLFFVYGTLRRGDDNDITRLAPAPLFLGSATIAGTMYHLGGYPGVTLGGTGRIVGEVYAVSTELERVLDEIETQYPVAPDFYVKRSIALQLQDQSVPTSVFVYEVNPAYVKGKPVIASGDWVLGRQQHLERKQ